MPAPDRFSHDLGIVSGLLLLAMFVSAIALAARPVVLARDRRFALAILILSAVTIVKLALLPYLPGVTVDLTQFEAWGSAMVQVGPSHVYDPEFVCRYTPAYLYALWPAAALTPTWPKLRIYIEAPAIIADFLAAVTVYAAARLASEVRFGLPASLCAILNPSFIYASTFWGQNDSAIAFPVMLSLVMALESRFALAWAIAIVAALIKAQGLLLLPILAGCTLLKGSFTVCLRAAGAAIATAVVVIAPFQLDHPWYFMAEVYRSSIGFFPAASVNAFNLMLVLGGFLELDSERVFGPVSYFVLGSVLFGAAYAVAAWIALRRGDARGLLYAVFLIYLAMFVLAPRMHERYLAYAIAMLAPLMFESLITTVLYAVLSAGLLVNMAYVYLDLIYVPGLVEDHLILGPGARLVLSIINVASFGLAAVYGVRIVSRRFAQGPAGPV